jgi:hypothetical protein
MIMSMIILKKLYGSYDRSIEDLIKAVNYNWVDKNIASANFPAQRSGKMDIEIEFIHFERVMRTEEALAEFDRRGYRAAEIRELLVFIEQYPNFQRDFPIAALGSIWRNPTGESYCAWLTGDGFQRLLGLYWIDAVWHANCRFAAVRKYPVIRRPR